MNKNGFFQLFKSISTSKKKTSTKKTSTSTSGENVRIVKTMKFSQPSSFRGFRKYRLTIYKEPGVNEGIEHFRNNNVKEHFEIKKGTPICLVLKEANSFKVMEVYVDNHKVGVIYNSREQYSEILSKPFDNVYIRIEEMEPPYIPGIDVYMFIHYVNS